MKSTSHAQQNAEERLRYARRPLFGCLVATHAKQRGFSRSRVSLARVRRIVMDTQLSTVISLHQAKKTLW